MAVEYTKYLKAKEEVDKRALNRCVLNKFNRTLHATHSPVTILELGGGTGAMMQRILHEWDGSSLEYHFVDASSSHIEAARQEVDTWMYQQGQFKEATTAYGRRLHCTRNDGTVEIHLREQDAFQALDHISARVDVIVAQSFLDLIHIPTLLDRLNDVCVADAVAYFPIHVNGSTRFLPTTQRAIDRHIEHIYHDSMNARETRHGPAGGASTGQKLLHAIPAHGGSIRAAGGSDWIIYPDAHGAYGSQDRYFLRKMLDFFDDEIGSSSEISEETGSEWIETRRAQLQRGELSLVAHHIDVLARLNRS